jgi:hypothetical protein
MLTLATKPMIRVAVPERSETSSPLGFAPLGGVLNTRKSRVLVPAENPELTTNEAKLANSVLLVATGVPLSKSLASLSTAQFPVIVAVVGSRGCPKASTILNTSR